MFENLEGFRTYVSEQEEKGNEWFEHESNLEGIPTVTFSRGNTIVVFDATTGEMLSYTDNYKICYMALALQLDCEEKAN